MNKNFSPSFIFALASLVCLAGVIYPFKPFKRRWVALASFVTCFFLVGIFAPEPTPSKTVSSDTATLAQETTESSPKYWVTSERLNRRTCPSDNCGVVGQFFFREGVTIHEQRDGWARVTNLYEASCIKGRSEYVDTGNASCDPANGITNGQFAEWVSADYLSKTRPPDPSENASGLEAVVADSDDFARYHAVFAEAARSLIAQSRCTERDFQEIGGWSKSSNHRNHLFHLLWRGNHRQPAVFECRYRRDIPMNNRSVSLHSPSAMCHS